MISFPIEQRVATAYVFCLLAEQDPELVDPQDLSQWRFWVVPTGKLHGERQIDRPATADSGIWGRHQLRGAPGRIEALRT